MKLFKTFVLFYILCCSLTSYAQSVIIGNWTGTLYQNPSPHTPINEYKFSMNIIEENEGIIKGVTTIIAGPNFGVIEFIGSFKNKVLHFNEYHIQKETENKPFSWCIKSGDLKLTQNVNSYILQGEWTGYTQYKNIKNSCSPGTITLKKEIDIISLKGFVIDSSTQKQLPSHISIIDLNSKEVIKEFDTNTGEFDIELPLNKYVEVYANAKGYIAHYERVTLKKSQIVNLALNPIKIGENIVLKYVLFERSKAILLPSSYNEIDKLVLLLKENPSMTIELEGHTSNEGNYQDNINLSAQRVQTVKKYLISKQINPNRVSTKAYGPSKPRYPNDSEENKSKNRRVEFKIISK